MGVVNDFLKKIGIGKPDIISPIAEDQSTATLADGSQATKSDEVRYFIDRVRDTRPQLKDKSDAFLAGLYLKYGNSIMPTEAPKPKQEKQGDSTVSIDKNTEAFLDNVVFPITRKYDIPDAVVAAQFAAEGRTEGLGASRNNYFNIAAFDNDLGRTQIFKTPQEGVEAYARFISGQGSYPSEEHKKRFQKAYELRNDPQKMLKEIELAGYAGDPKTYAARAQNNYPSYSDFAMATPEWKKYATNRLSIDQAIRP